MQQTVLITGGSRGIGAAMARAFAAAGYAVAVNYHRSEAEARALFNELVAEKQPRDRFITETKCGGNPEGYALVLEANTFEDVDGNGDFDEFVDGETLDCVEYTADDYNGEH